MKKVLYSLMVAGVLATGLNSCSKTCDAGYEGSDCKTEVREKFIGQFKGDETCTAGTDNYTVTVAKSSTDVLKVTLSNIYNQAFVATATIDGSTLTIASQTVATNVTVSGTGTLSGDSKTLTLTYSISNSATSSNNSCTFVGVKQ